jgi:hypothetical protein
LAKKQKRDEGSSGGDKDGGDVFVSWKEQVQNMSGEEFEAFLKAKADEILDKAAKTVIEDLADKVMGEADEAVQEVVRSAEGELDGVGTEAEREERLLVAAGVPEATKAQIRASPRLQRSKDEHTLAKAEGRVARRNLELSEGISSSAPLFSINRDLAMTCLQQLGFNLGDSSVDKDKNLNDLLGVGLGGVEGGVECDGYGEGFESEVESVDEFERKALKSLCGDLMEEVFDESSFPVSGELDNITRKGKFHAKSCLRRTCKLRRAFFSNKGSK